MNTLSPADLNAMKFERNADMLAALVAELNASLPYSSWRVDMHYGGMIIGRHDVMEFDACIDDSGVWAVSATRSDVFMSDYEAFELDAHGADLVALVHELIAEASVMKRLTARFAA